MLSWLMNLDFAAGVVGGAQAEESEDPLVRLGAKFVRPYPTKALRRNVTLKTPPRAYKDG